MTVISHERRFIFIKTRKVAGTSIEGVLRRFCGPDDIVTPITPIDEKALVEQNLPPRNFAKDGKTSEEKYVSLVKTGDLDAAREALHSMEYKFRNHMRALEVKRRVGEEVWSDYLKFTVERHPYSYIISACTFNSYSYNRGIEEIKDETSIRKNLDNFLSKLPNDRFLNSRMYSDNNGKPLVDFIIRYENIQEDLQTCLLKLGVDASEVRLPAFKSNGRYSVDQARELMTPSQRMKIRDYFHATFETMGYES